MSANPDIEHVFRAWHEAITAGAADRIADLYAPNGVIETPAAAVLAPDLSSGVVQGRESIRAFFTTSLAARQRDGVFAGWWRTGTYLTDGRLLMWEYPRQTPHGEQTDLMEVMEIENDLIVSHRVYWGWIGFKKLHAVANETATSS